MIQTNQIDTNISNEPEGIGRNYRIGNEMIDAPGNRDNKPSENPFDFNDQPNIARFVVEGLLYLSISLRVFAKPLGVLAQEGFSGGVILVSGIICFVLIFMRQEKFPRSFYFVLGISFISGLVMVAEEGGVPLQNHWFKDLVLFWPSLFLMSCYVVRNDAACKRFAAFLGLCVIIAVYLGGFYRVHRIDQDQVSRLYLKGVGSMFSNPNALAYLSGNLAVALLFFSLRSKRSAAILYGIISVSLLAILLDTVSRGGLIFSVAGLGFFALAQFFRKGGKGWIVFFVFIVLGVGINYSYELANTRDDYLARIEVHSARVDTWASIFSDVKDTLISGRGPSLAYSYSTGVRPHNCFLWLHLAFGGLVAWLYASWIIGLILRCWRFLKIPQVRPERKFELLGIFVVALGCQIMTNAGFLYYGVIFATAMVEKYTSIFSSGVFPKTSYIFVSSRNDKGEVNAAA